MFEANIYIKRRKHLAREIGDGLIVLIGNKPVPMNYPSNTLRFRQDSNFLYYCGLDYENLVLTIDCASEKSTLYGDDLTVDEIVWEGQRTSIKTMAELSGIDRFETTSKLQGDIFRSNDIHTLPVYREDQKYFLQSLLNNSDISSSKPLVACVTVSYTHLTLPTSG